jgi:SAM-dependent methyltransferase
MLQSDIFFQGEGDAWFARNQQVLLNQSQPNTQIFDWVCWIREQLAVELHRVGELGCANGWRLQRLQSRYPESEFYGVDASQSAIHAGQTLYPTLRLQQGVLHDLPWERDFFDLCIIYGVLCWIDRHQLAASIAEMDRVIRDGGYLILGDFLPDYPQRRNYHHLPESQVYTYKQDYAKCLTALGTYHEIARLTYDHQLEKGLGFQAVASPDRFSCVLLQKNLFQGYPDV